MSRKAALETINYELIKAKDPNEIQKLLKASRPPPEGLGVFYLDLRGPSTSASLRELDAVYAATEKYFRQDQDYKLAAKRDGVERGYKKFPNVETFEVARDEEKQGTHDLPTELQPAKLEFSQLSSACEVITKDLANVLSEALGVSKPFAPDGPSDSGFKVCLISDAAKESEVIGGEHTDMGLITCLFYTAPTMEIPIHGTDEWALIESIPGCPVVNVADTLQNASSKELFSPLHRVVQPKGENLSALYLLRPAHAAA
ncbi:hypothetical protein G7054_g9004 [Neopestalotiopsis clavispora]|nr:hypothetical protein G7054_g9004 [Neopestalotiopsis clavispora]